MRFAKFFTFITSPIRVLVSIIFFKISLNNKICNKRYKTNKVCYKQYKTNKACCNKQNKQSKGHLNFICRASAFFFKSECPFWAPFSRPLKLSVEKTKWNQVPGFSKSYFLENVPWHEMLPSSASELLWREKWQSCCRQRSSLTHFKICNTENPSNSIHLIRSKEMGGGRIHHL